MYVRIQNPKTFLGTAFDPVFALCFADKKCCDLGLRNPLVSTKRNPKLFRGYYYFTPKGWKTIGKPVYQYLKKAGCPIEIHIRGGKPDLICGCGNQVVFYPKLSLPQTPYWKKREAI